MQNYAAENDGGQGESAERGGGVLAGGAPKEKEQKQKCEMNADFDSEKTANRDGPTTHGHAYKYSNY
jgi:hypothetical protein